MDLIKFLHFKCLESLAVVRPYDLVEAFANLQVDQDRKRFTQEFGVMHRIPLTFKQLLHVHLQLPNINQLLVMHLSFFLKSRYPHLTDSLVVKDLFDCLIQSLLYFIGVLSNRGLNSLLPLIQLPHPGPHLLRILILSFKPRIKYAFKFLVVSIYLYLKFFHFQILPLHVSSYQLHSLEVCIPILPYFNNFIANLYLLVLGQHLEILQILLDGLHPHIESIQLLHLLLKIFEFIERAFGLTGHLFQVGIEGPDLFLEQWDHVDHWNHLLIHHLLDRCKIQEIVERLRRDFVEISPLLFLLRVLP